MNVITAEAGIASSAPVAKRPRRRIPQRRTPLRRGGSRTRAALTLAMVADATKSVNRTWTDDGRLAQDLRVAKLRCGGQDGGAERDGGPGRDLQVVGEHEPRHARQR